MYLTRLELTNYRNYAALDLHLTPGVSLFLGDNAQGKTNLLESIYLLATTRTSRGGSDLDLIRWAALEDPASPAVSRVAGWARRRQGDVEVEIGVSGTRATAGSNGQGLHASKRLRVNGLPRRASDVVGQIAAVLFTAQDIDLLTGPPATRRRYLDITFSQVDHPYLRALQRYSKVLLQRNSLLRQLQEGHGRADQLGFWDQELVREAATIQRTRAEGIGWLGEQAAAFHQRLSDEQETLSITYLPQLAPGLDASVLRLPGEELRGRLIEHLRARQRQEIAAGASLYGPHRDEVAFAVNGVSAGSFGSRAQQRTAALALRLAEMRYIETQSGDAPVLLLDDILSELDERRRHSVLAVMHGDQVLVTATESDRLSSEFLASARLYRVESGQVSEGTGDRE
jgi:DNA replication and repair protein RecF